jgi:threonine/homoserine/homoserine lactone efflux protein
MGAHDVHTTLLLRGFLLGLSIAAPVGPIGVLCIHRTLSEGRAMGFVSGLGAATADAVYGSVAAFGLVSVSGFLSAQRTTLRLLGGAFLCYLGLRALLSRPPVALTHSGTSGLLRAYGSAALLTLTNPMTILSFAALFSGLGVTGGQTTYGSAAALVAGVLLGSASWWLALSLVVDALRHRISADSLQWVNRAAGIAMLVFASLIAAGVV